MKVTAQENLIPVTPFQISEITTGTFAISGITHPADVLAPLVSVEPETSGTVKSLSIKIIVFIPTPLLGVNQLQLYLDPDTASGELKLVMQYSSSEMNPTAYHPWFISYVHNPKPGEEISIVNTSLQNIVQTSENPRTKRGTVTHVLES